MYNTSRIWCVEAPPHDFYTDSALSPIQLTKETGEARFL